MSDEKKEKEAVKAKAAIRRIFQTPDGRILYNILINKLQQDVWAPERTIDNKRFSEISENLMRHLEGQRQYARLLLNLGDAIENPPSQEEDV